MLKLLENMVNLINLKESFDFSEYTLIIPSVSVGNVAQLTVDLIITTYKLKKIATIWHPGLIPSVGGDPYHLEAQEPCTACELYTSKDCNIAVIQLRSSIEFRLGLNFFELLKNDIIHLKFKDVIILTSTFAYELHNIESSHFRYITNRGNEYENLNVLQMPSLENGKYAVNGSGFAIKLFELLQNTIKCTIFFKYVSEGDNTPDAIAMLNLLKESLNSFKNNDYNIVYPISWKYVFGNPPPIGIF